MRRAFPRLLALLGLVPLLAGARPTDAATLEGTWKLTVETPNGKVEPVMKLKQEGEKITGSIAGPDGNERPLEAATLKGNELQFTITVERDGQTMKRSFKMTFDGDSVKGTVEGGSGTRSFTGARQAAPAAATVLLNGVWNLSIEAPNQTYHPTVTLTQDGEKLTGTLKTEDGTEAKLVSGSVKGEAVNFVVDLSIGGMDLHLDFSAKRNEKGLKGDLNVNGMTVPWSAERAPAPAAK